MKLVFFFMLLQYAVATKCSELIPDKEWNISASDRTIFGGTWSAFFRVVISTTEYGRTENNDAEIQLIYHEHDSGFDYNVIANSPHMSDIYTCSTPHDPAKGYGHTTIHMNTNYQDGAKCTLTYDIFDANGNVQFRNPVFQYGKRQPKGKQKCSAPKPKTDATVLLKKAEVDVERNTKNTKACIPEVTYTTGEAKTICVQVCKRTVNHVVQVSAHNCKGKLYLCDGRCGAKANFPGKEKGWCIIS